MICADFLAGASLESGKPEILLQSVMRVFKFLPDQDRHACFEQASGKASSGMLNREATASNCHRMRTKNSGSRYSDGMAGGVKVAAVVRICRFIIRSFGRTRDQIPRTI
jgi:hypothetical protein